MMNPQSTSSRFLPSPPACQAKLKFTVNFLFLGSSHACCCCTVSLSRDFKTKSLSNAKFAKTQSLLEGTIISPQYALMVRISSNGHHTTWLLPSTREIKSRRFPSWQLSTILRISTFLSSESQFFSSPQSSRPLTTATVRFLCPATIASMICGTRWDRKPRQDRKSRFSFPNKKCTKIRTSDENSMPRKSMSNPFLHSLVQAIRPLIFAFRSRSLACFSSSCFFFCSALFFSSSSSQEGLRLEIMLLACLQRKQDPPSLLCFLEPPNWHAVQQGWSSFSTFTFEVLTTLPVASAASPLNSSALCGFGLTDSSSKLSTRVFPAWLQRSLYARSRPSTTFSYLPVWSLQIHRFGYFLK